MKFYTPPRPDCQPAGRSPVKTAYNKGTAGGKPASKQNNRGFSRITRGTRSTMSNLKSGARPLIECMLREHVEGMFGCPGGVTLPFYDVLCEGKVKHYLVRHE